MSIKQPFTELKIKKQVGGFYHDNSLPIALMSKGIMVTLVVWALVWPANANGTLGSINGLLLEFFNIFYIFIVGFFAFFERAGFVQGCYSLPDRIVWLRTLFLVSTGVCASCVA